MITVGERILIGMFIVGVSGLMVYKSFFAPSEKNVYQSDSKPTDISFSGPRLFDFYFGCSPLKGGRPDAVAPKK